MASTDAAVWPEEESAEFDGAFARVEHEILGVSEDDVLPINVDVPTVVAMVTGSLPELRELSWRARCAAGVRGRAVRQAAHYALALAHTHARFRGASGPENRVAERSALQLEELEHAGRKAQELVIAVGVREQGPGTVNAVMLLRQRAFTLLANAYDHVRRGVGYLRWDRNDADSIAPSLYAGRGGKPGVMPPAQPPAEDEGDPRDAASELRRESAAPCLRAGLISSHAGRQHHSRDGSARDQSGSAHFSIFRIVPMKSCTVT